MVIGGGAIVTAAFFLTLAVIDYGIVRVAKTIIRFINP